MTAAVESDPGFAAIHPAARDGADLARLNALRLAGKEQASEELQRRLRDRLPRGLIERRDPSVAEMWAAPGD